MKIIFIYFLSISAFFAQEINTVTYQAFITYKARDASFEDFETNYTALSGNVFFELNFNEAESSFKYKEHTTVVTDFYVEHFVSQTVKYNNYYNKVENKFFFKQKEDWFFEGFDKYLISYQNKNPWTITNTSKVIDGKTCYLATSTNTFRLVDKLNEKIEAWFCPELPYNYGPGFFNGLPGLILELKSPTFGFLATKVDLNKKEKFEFSKYKGELIDFDAFNQKAIDILKEIRKQ